MRITFLFLLVVAMVGVMTTTIVSVAETSPTRLPLRVTDTQLTKDAQTQVECLAQNIYYEAGYEPHDGKIAVALVTLNRVNDPRFPKDICGVVKQKNHFTCQFTWWCEPKRAKNENSYAESKRVALYVYANYEYIKDFTRGSLYYHADYVRPGWKGLEKTITIGRHIFYKEKVVS